MLSVIVVTTVTCMLCPESEEAHVNTPGGRSFEDSWRAGHKRHGERCCVLPGTASANGGKAKLNRRCSRKQKISPRFEHMYGWLVKAI